MLSYCKTVLLQTSHQMGVLKKREFYSWLNYMFNRVSHKRIAQVGPDRACAEWLMRNGAFIKWKGHPTFVSHYNNLPLDESNTTTYHLEEVNAEEASLTHHGFPHFCGCNHVKNVRLHKCWYVDDLAVKQLDLLANSLTSLEITLCHEVSDQGVTSLAKLKNLKQLKIGGLSSVKDIKKCISELSTALPDCSINVADDKDKKELLST